jgi:hypothetical protein
MVPYLTGGSTREDQCTHRGPCRCPFALRRHHGERAAGRREEAGRPQQGRTRHQQDVQEGRSRHERAGSKAHNELTDAGNATKTTLKKATGIKAPQSHQPGGLNKVARDISKTSKKAGSDIKAEKNRVKSKAHGEATEAGKSLKDTVLKSN